MHKAVCLLAGFIFCLTTHAQVTAELLLNQEQFIPGESVFISVRIVNRSGETLKLGGQPDWLTFTVDGKDDATVERNGDVPVVGEFTLESAKMATKVVQLTPYYFFTKPGRYRLTAYVRIPGWSQMITSPPKSLQVAGGTKLWEVEFGVPRSGAKPGDDAAPQVRTYTLVKSAQLDVKSPRFDRLALYVRVSADSDPRPLKVSEIGSLISFSQPEPQLDRFSNLHVLWQSGARTYTYVAVNPEGQILTRQTYDFEGTRPKLSSNEETGRIRVAGGERRKSATDIPPE